VLGTDVNRPFVLIVRAVSSLSHHVVTFYYHHQPTSLWIREVARHSRIKVVVEHRDLHGFIGQAVLLAHTTPRCTATGGWWCYGTFSEQPQPQQQQQQQQRAHEGT
jgi:hypothetical protein